MNPPANARQLFDAALAIDTSARADWLARHCEDEEQRALIERMLALDADDTGSVIDQSFEALLDEVGHPGSAAWASGTRIGSFQLHEKLGEGGSSIVFRASREQAGVSQNVALKLLRRNLYTHDEQRRFRDERSALSRLQHPGIARLIEGGITESGTPFIALELVEGQSIVEHARSHQLDLQQRLRLFVDVCRAVEAAHRALIVHRDLKPSNVLVTADGHVKLLDFGIAKLLDGDAMDQTQTLHLPMTPAYAAPEQFSREPITTATDVYALGTVLGELLSGQRLEQGDSRTPSARVTETIASEVRLTSARQMRRRLRGDLDNIVSKATATEPERRYASAGAFADDIQRHLDGQPVTAHPPSRAYRARKFVARHRGGVLVITTFAIGILSALGIAIWQADLARNQTQRANSVRDFLLDVFRAAEPAGPRLAPPSVVDVVRASVTEARQSHSLYPAVRVELLEALGGVLRTLGEHDESVRILEDNYRDSMAILGKDDPATVLAGFGLANAQVAAGHRPQARALFDELLQRKERLDPSLRSRMLAASALLGVNRFERELAMAQSLEAVSTCETSCDASSRINALLSRGHVLAGFQQDSAAIPILEQTLAAQGAHYRGPHVAIADTQQALSRAYRRKGNLDHAKTLARESLAIVEASVPDPHVRRTRALDTLRQVLIDTREFDEAETLGLQIVAMNKATLGPDNPAVATSENTLGFTYIRNDKLAQAIEHYLAALELSERIPDNQRRSAIYRANLGVCVGRAGDLTRGLQMIDTAIAALRALREPDHDQIASALEKRGLLQRLGGDAATSAATYREALSIYKEKLPDSPKAWHVVSLVGLGRARLEIGDNDGAAHAFGEALANETTPVDRVSPERIEARAGLAAALLGLGNATEAEALLELARGERAAARGRLPAALQAFVDGVAASVVAR